MGSQFKTVLTFPFLTFCATSLISLGCLAGWIFGFTPIVGPGHAPMNPLSAILGLFAGFSLFSLSLQRLNTKSSTYKLVGKTLALIVTGTAIANLLSAAGLPFSLDQVLSQSRSSQNTSHLLNKMPAQAALCFMMTGVSLLLCGTTRKRVRHLQNSMAFCIAFIGLVISTGYFYGVHGATQIPLLIPMAPQSGLLFFVLGIGILSIDTSRGIGRLFGSAYSGSVMARKAVPIAVVIPLLLGKLRLVAQGAGLLTVEAAVTAMVMIGMLIFILLILHNARIINQAAAKEKEIREALAENQRTLKTLMENLPGMAYRCKNDPSWTMEFLSEGSAVLLGYRPEELGASGSTSYGALIHPDDQSLVWEKVQKGIESKSPYEITYRVQTKNAKEKWVWERGCGVFSADGELEALEGFVSDFTEIKNAENQLQGLLSLQRATLDSTADGIICLDFDQSITFYNKRFLEMWGLSISAIEREGYQAVYDAALAQMKNPAQVIEQIKKAHSVDSEVSTDIYELRDGRYIERSAVPQKLGDRILGLVISCRDVTLSKKAEKELKQRNLFLENAFEGVASLDLEGRYISLNGAYARSLGWKPEEVVNKNWSEFIYPDDLKKAGDASKICASQGKAEVELKGIRKDGSLLHQRVTLVAVSDLGKPSGYYHFIKDITEQRRAEKKVLEQEEKLVQSSKMASLGQMAGGIAHEINNPLAIIQCHTDELRDWAENPSNLGAVSALANGIDDIVLRISKIVEGLRLFARDSREIDKVDEKVAKIVENTLSFCREKFNNHGVALKVEPIPDNVSLRCEPVQISQVLLNLLNNARDAVSPFKEKWVSIRAERVGRFIEISVTDSGKGINEEVQSKIFEPFFTTKDIGQGTGLGLSVSKGIVEKHGGTLSLDARSRNTRFIIRLPASVE